MTVCLCHCVERRTCCNNELRMSGISRSFKVPSFIKSKKRKISHSLPTFNLENVSNLKELGIGSFGVVYSANYVGATDNGMVVVKKLRGECPKKRVIFWCFILLSISASFKKRRFASSDSPLSFLTTTISLSVAPT